MMDLALRMGQPNPDRMLQQMESRHVTEWRAYFKLLNVEEQSRAQGRKSMAKVKPMARALRRRR